jgi:hypothetical protein
MSEIRTGNIDPIKLENLMNVDKVMAALNEIAPEISQKDLVQGFYEQVAALNQTVAVLKNQGLVVEIAVNREEEIFWGAESLIAQVFDPL